MIDASSVLSDRLQALLDERTEANRAFFGDQAERLARLCHLMAERFARGGRLVAFGCTPTAIFRPWTSIEAASPASGCVRRVSMIPNPTAFTVTLYRPHSLDIVFVSPTTPAFPDE